MRTSDICPTCSIFTNALCTLYNGAFLPTLDINTLESLETSLIKIEAWALANSSGTPTLQSVTTAGAVSTIGITVPSVQFDLAAAVTVAPGQFAWNADEETMNLGIDANSTLQLGQEDFYHVTNSSGADIADGTPVMAIGTSGASGRILIGPMDGSILDNSKYFLGIATAPILNGANGKITKWGKVRDLDTTGTPHGEVWAEANIIYIDPTVIGGLTNVEPTAGMKLPIAFVVRAHATTGLLAVRAKSGSGLHELHDVDVTGLVDGMHLQYNGTSSNWEVVAAAIPTLQTVIDAGNQALSLDTNSWLTVNLVNESSQFEWYNYNATTFDETNVVFGSNFITIVQGDQPTGARARLDITNGRLELDERVGVNSTTVGFWPATGITTLNFPARASGTYTFPLTVNGVTADTTGEINLSSVYVNLSGNQTITGTKIFNTGDVNSNIESVNNGAGGGIRSDNTAEGYGIYSENTSNGDGIHSFNTSSGIAITADASLAATGFNYVGSNQGTATFTVDKFGDVVGNTFKTVGSVVGSLPAGVVGQRSHVTDSTVVAAGNFGATVVGGGANTVPVFYDGTNWIIA